MVFVSFFGLKLLGPSSRKATPIVANRAQTTLQRLASLMYLVQKGAAAALGSALSSVDTVDEHVHAWSVEP